MSVGRFRRRCPWLGGPDWRGHWRCDAEPGRTGHCISRARAGDAGDGVGVRGGGRGSRSVKVGRVCWPVGPVGTPGRSGARGGWPCGGGRRPWSGWGGQIHSGRPVRRTARGQVRAGVVGDCGLACTTWLAPVTPSAIWGARFLCTRLPLSTVNAYWVLIILTRFSLATTLLEPINMLVIWTGQFGCTKPLSSTVNASLG